MVARLCNKVSTFSVARPVGYISYHIALGELNPVSYLVEKTLPVPLSNEKLCLP